MFHAKPFRIPAKFVHLAPALGILPFMTFLDEQPALYHAVGIGLFFAGIWLSTRRIT